MRPSIKYLSDAEVVRVHEKALEMLENLGMKFEGAETREYFAKAGAEVSGQIVKIPRSIIEEGLKTVPKREEFVLYGRTPDKDVHVKDRVPSLAAMTMATHVLDPETGLRRKATDRDLALITRIMEKLDTVTIASALVTPQDVPMAASDWYTWATSIKNTTKHITGGAVGKEGVRDAIKMASLAVGSEEEFLKRPFISFWVLTMPPLRVDENTSNVLMEAAVHKVPSVISSGGILGMTSPMSVESALVHTHAETLACIALSQLVNPGAPVIYSSYVRSMDMKTMCINMSSPESIIMKVGMSQMGDYVGLPTKMPANLRDGKVLDAQAGFETGMGGLAGALSCDFIVSMQLDMDLMVDFADMIYSDECMQILQRMARPLSFDDETLAYDNMEEVGPGNTFLETDHTFEHFKDEIWMPRYMERGTWENWEANGSRDIRDICAEKVKDMLEELRDYEILPKDVRDAIDAVAAGSSEKAKNIKR